VTIMSALSNPETEATVLGCALLNKDALYRIAPLLSPDDFSLDAHRRIYHTVLGLANAGEPVDDLTVVDALTAAGQLEAVGGVAVVTNLGAQVSAGMARIANVEKYAKTILDKARRRKMHAAAVALQAAAEDAQTSTDDCSGQIQEALLAIEASSSNKLGWHIREIIPEANAEIERQSQTKGLVGFRTGIHLLDKMTGGIRRGELWTIGALPGKGKSACGLQISLENAAKKVPVMFFSIEMTAIEITKRFFAATSKVSASQIRNPYTVSKEGWRELANAAGEVADLPIYGDDRGTLKIDQLLASARLHIRRYGVQLIVVDYLQCRRRGGRLETE
jgi:replicative DNA helicase